MLWFGLFAVIFFLLVEQKYQCFGCWLLNPWVFQLDFQLCICSTNGTRKCDSQPRPQLRQQPAKLESDETRCAASTPGFEELLSSRSPAWGLRSVLKYSPELPSCRKRKKRIPFPSTDGRDLSPVPEEES